MNNTLSTQFEQYGTWRASVLQSVGEFQDWLQAQELYDAQADMRAQRIRGVLRSDKLKVAFIAEFSRGKSELINAIFFCRLWPPHSAVVGGPDHDVSDRADVRRKLPAVDPSAADRDAPA